MSKKLTSEWNQKQQHFISHTSISLLCIQFVAVAFQSEEVFLKKETPPVTFFCFTLDPPLGGYGQNILMHVRGHEHFIPSKFRKHPFGGSVVKADCVPIHIHALVHPPSLFRHLNKYIENSLKFFKHLNPLFKHLPLTYIIK